MGEAKGTYSNKIVSDKPLTVGIGFYPDLGACFILMEGNYKANLYTGYNFSLDVKTPTGEEYGFWMVPRSGGRFFPCLGPTKKINKHEYWDEFSQFIELLKKEKYLKCYLIDNKYQSYTFKIDCIGFTKAYEKFLRLNNIESLPILSTEFLYNIPE
ncbi:MAG: hypothetical protein K2L21_07835 [Muribaculaceae bacterium]|nr:hypothetical protein [Muribaculaceae bacterium]